MISPPTVAFDSARAIDRQPADRSANELLSTNLPLGLAGRSLVIIPTYNERDNLSPLVHAVLAVDSSLDILVIDDGSPDGTGAIADLLAHQTRGRVRVMHRSGKLGLGTAYVAGFAHALAHGYERVVEMDADFSHRPEDLPRLLQAANSADVVIGSRNVPGGRAPGWSPVRNAISKGGSLYARWLLGLPVRDCTSGFKCFRRRALEVLDLPAVRSNGYGFQVEVNYVCASAGMRFAEVPIVFTDRVRGASKMSWHIVVEAAWLVLRLRIGLSRVPVTRVAAEVDHAVRRGTPA
jgi:dolichol-phosphate mannosyltransferase